MNCLFLKQEVIGKELKKMCSTLTQRPSAQNDDGPELFSKGIGLVQTGKLLFQWMFLVLCPYHGVLTMSICHIIIVCTEKSYIQQKNYPNPITDHPSNWSNKFRKRLRNELITWLHTSRFSLIAAQNAIRRDCVQVIIFPACYRKVIRSFIHKINFESCQIQKNYINMYSQKLCYYFVWENI